MNEENNLNTQPVVNTDQQTPAPQPQTTEPIQTPPVVEQDQITQQQPQMQPQPNVMPQPMPNQMQGPNNNITPAMKNGHNMIVIILVAVVVALIIFLVVTFVIPKSKDKDKKEDNQQEENNNKEENKEDNKNNEDKENNKDSSYIEGDWTSMKFHFDGHTYTLTSSVQELIKNGWDFDPKYLKEQDSLEPMYKTYTSIPLLNPKYSDSDVSVAIINKTSETKKFSECTFWSVNISNDWIDTPLEFSLPGGIKNGSTLAEIEKVYGKPDPDSIYRSDKLKYYSYTYEKGDLLLELTIYDDKGLTEFKFKYYG